MWMAWLLLFNLQTGTLELKKGETAIEYIAHASFRLHAHDGRRIVIDPYADKVWLGYEYPAALPAEAVLITHPHYDHDAGGRMGRPFPWRGRVKAISDPGRVRVGDFKIRGVAGKHADPYGHEFGQKNVLMMIEIGGLRILHLGDNGPLTPENVEAVGRVDVLMMPIDGDFHILKEQEIEDILAALKPRVLIPMHYRIPELEPEDGPKDLGEIDPWLKGRPNVTRLKSHVAVLSKRDLPEAMQIVVFQPSPQITRPSRTR